MLRQEGKRSTGGIVRLVCLAFFFLLVFASPALSENMNRALLISCDRFVSMENTPLSGAGNLTRIADMLSGHSGGFGRIIVRTGDVSTPEMLEAALLDAFGDADDRDVSYFFFSTHGQRQPEDRADEMTFLLSDGVQETTVTAGEMRIMLDRIRGTKVLILDACYAGAVIGKGADVPMENIFEGKEYKVLCSSGADEESWFWDDDVNTGAGYFSEALYMGLSGRGGYDADANRDGAITLTEARDYLLRHHGASTVRCYPEEDDFVLLTYPLEIRSHRNREAVVENITWEDGALSADCPELQLTFNVVRPVRVLYQVTYRRQGRWDFDRSVLLPDDGILDPGLKLKSLTLDAFPTGESGYALIQLIAETAGRTEILSTHVITVLAEGGEMAASVDAPAAFAPDLGCEMNFTVRASIPAEMTVTITDSAGRTVRRLLSSAPTRPQQLSDPGVSLCWNGLDDAGAPVPPGTYSILVRLWDGENRTRAEAAFDVLPVDETQSLQVPDMPESP